MTLSSAPRFRRTTRAAVAATLLLVGASAGQAGTACKALGNGKFCLTSDDFFPFFYRGSYQKWAGSPVSGYMQLETSPVDHDYGNFWFYVKAGERWDRVLGAANGGDCARGWMVVPAQGLTAATPWTC